MSNKDLAFFKRQEAYEVVVLAQPIVLDMAKKVMKKCLGREVELKEFYSCSDAGVFLWEGIRDRFLEICRQAKAVVLPAWVQVRGITASDELIAKIAEEVAAVNPRIKIFAFLIGNTWEALVHKVNNKEGKEIVEKIYSFADPELINTLKVA